ncbi:MAG: biopolymer transporter ExbD [Bradyrhizobium sp.]|nr:biopolymer transporter ExbD [Bradyrhizobium sp.]
MAVSIAGSEFDDEGDFAETHEINVTPFIDVMLVLLIIFMVAAPLATVDLPVDLPTSSAVSQKKPDKPTYLTIKADLSLAIGETPVKRAELIQALDGMPGINPETARERPIFVRGDRSVPYGEVMDLLELLQLGNYTKFKLVAEEKIAEKPAQPPAQAKP